MRSRPVELKVLSPPDEKVKGVNVSSAGPVGAPEASAKILRVTVTLLAKGESSERVTEFNVYSKLSVVNDAASQLFPEKFTEPEPASPRLLTTWPA